jgi:hypothetical protein
MNNDQYVDAISAPKFDPSTRTKRKPQTKRDRIDQIYEEDAAAAAAAYTVQTAKTPQLVAGDKGKGRADGPSR